MDEIEKLAEIFKALSDPTRLRLIKSLTKNDGALCVNRIGMKETITITGSNFGVKFPATPLIWDD